MPTSTADAFATFDANRSGFIDYRELRRALEHYGINVADDAAAQDVLRAYDANPDGKLELTEFAALVADIEKGFVSNRTGGGGGGGRGGSASKSGRAPAAGTRPSRPSTAKAPRARAGVTHDVEAAFESFDRNRAASSTTASCATRSSTMGSR